jgi:hypothetical protein
MTDLRYVAHCGLYCRLCTNLARIPQQSAALRDTLRKEGWEHFGKHTIQDFDRFWVVLEKLSQFSSACQGCRGGCGNPDCRIRQCASAKKVERCSSCLEYPCSHIEDLAKRYPNLLSDGARQKEIGIEKWVGEQEGRFRAGFCYADVRHPS